MHIVTRINTKLEIKKEVCFQRHKQACVLKSQLWKMFKDCCGIQLLTKYCRDKTVNSTKWEYICVPFTLVTQVFWLHYGYVIYCFTSCTRWIKIWWIRDDSLSSDETTRTKYKQLTYMKKYLKAIENVIIKNKHGDKM